VHLHDSVAQLRYQQATVTDVDIARDGVAERVPGPRGQQGQGHGQAEHAGQGHAGQQGHADQHGAAGPPVQPPAPGPEPVDTPWQPPAELPSHVSALRPPPNAPEPVDRRRQVAVHLAWAVPALLMLGLGLLGLSSAGLWGDELFTWGVLQLSWADFRELSTEFDTALMPYYLLMRGWIALAGDSDAALRLPSVLAAAAAAGVVGRLGTRMATPLAGLFAGLVFVAVPAMTRYAQEARPYMIAVFAAALATLALLRVTERPTLWRLAGYAAAVAFVGLAHLIALALIVAHGVWLATVRRDLLLRWAAAVAVGVLPVLPLIWYGFGQRNSIGWIANSDYRQLQVFVSSVFGTLSVAATVLALGLLGISRQARLLPYVFWATVPPAVLYVAGLMFGSVWLSRYMLFVVPAWALLAAVTLVRGPVVGAIGVIAVLAAVSIPIQKQWREPAGHNLASKQAAAIISERYQPGDVVVYGVTGPGQILATRDLVNHYVPADRRPVEPLLKRAPRTDGRIYPDICYDVSGCLKNPPRIWLVRIGSPQNPVAGLGGEYDKALRNYVVQQRWNPRGLTIALLTSNRL
jgi:mannosyltransferase